MRQWDVQTIVRSGCGIALCACALECWNPMESRYCPRSKALTCLFPFLLFLLFSLCIFRCLLLLSFSLCLFLPISLSLSLRVSVFASSCPCYQVTPICSVLTPSSLGLTHVLSSLPVCAAWTTLPDLHRMQRKRIAKPMPLQPQLPDLESRPAHLPIPS